MLNKQNAKQIFINDANEPFRKKILATLILLIVVLPFSFIYIKYQEDPQPVQKQPAAKELKDEIVINKLLPTYTMQVMDDLRYIKLSHDGNRLFVYGHDRGGIAIIDVSDPKKIKQLGIYYFPEAKFHPENVGIAQSADGRTLYVVSANRGLLQLDISDPKRIRQIGHLPLERPYKIVLSSDGSKAYVKVWKGLSVIDIKNKMALINTYEKYNERATYLYSNGTVAELSENLVLMSENFSRTLSILNVEDPEHITEVESIGLSQMTHNMTLSDDKQWLYVTSFNYITFFDVSDPNKIQPMGGYTIDEGYAHSVSILKENQTLLVPRHKTGLDILDISYPLDPTRQKNIRIKDQDIQEAVASFDNQYIFIAYNYKSIGVLKQ